MSGTNLAKYQIEVRDQYGRLVTTITRPMNKQFTSYRNRAGSCQFTMDLFDPQATESYLKINLYDIVFRRFGTPVFSGQISYLDPQIDGDRKTLSVIATGYLDLFDYRVVTPDFPGFDVLHNKIEFTSTDVSTVISNLIDYTQFPVITTDGYQTINGTDDFSQQFLSPSTGNLNTVKLLLKNSSATGNLTVGIYTDNQDTPLGTVIGTPITVAVGTVTSNFTWITFDFSALGVTLSEDTKYWMTCTLDTVQSGSNGIQWSKLIGEYYPNGFSYSVANPGVITAGDDFQFFTGFSDNAWQMTKNTFMGFQPGTINSSFVLSPTFDAYKKIKGAIDDMSNTYNGVDFAFTTVIDSVTNYMKKYYNIYYPRIGVDNTRLPFMYPGNIKKIDRPIDGKTMQNEIIMRGKGYGTAQTVTTVRDNTSIYIYFLRQGISQEADVTDLSTLTSQGNELIRVSKTILDLPKVTLDGAKQPAIGSYGVGDLILIQSAGPSFLNFSSYFRIEEISVTINDDDVEEASLTLSVA